MSSIRKMQNLLWYCVCRREKNPFRRSQSGKLEKRASDEQSSSVFWVLRVEVSTEIRHWHFYSLFNMKCNTWKREGERGKDVRLNRWRCRCCDCVSICTKLENRIYVRRTARFDVKLSFAFHDERRAPLILHRVVDVVVTAASVVPQCVQRCESFKWTFLWWISLVNRNSSNYIHIRFIFR